MRHRVASWCALILASLASGPTLARAQRVLGIGDDALVLPRGVFRVRVLGQWTDFNQRYGMGTPGRPDGALEPLAIDFNLDTIGTVQFPSLTPLQSGLRSLSGMPDLTLSLGRTIVTSQARIAATPVVLEAGLTSKFSMGLTVPIVRTRNNIFFDVNPLGREGNVGFNPAFASSTAAAANAAFKAQFDSANAFLTRTLAACAAAPTAPGCASVNANRTNIQNLISNGAAFAGGVSQIYGTSLGAGSPFVPVSGSDVELSIDARATAFKGLYQSFGVAASTFTGGLLPIGAQNRLGLAEAQRILTDPAFGVLADPLQTVERSHIGDIELGGKFKFIDTFKGSTEARLHPKGFNYRSAVTGLLRFGTGQTDSPNNFVDVGTGNGQNDLEGRLATDLLWGSRFWVSLIGRGVIQLKDDQFVRISDRPNQQLTAQFRYQKVHRDLGNYFELEADPRVALNDYFGVGLHYWFRRKGVDRYTGTFKVDSAVTGYGDVVLNASTMDAETGQMEHRFGGGLSFSTISAFEQGKAKIPFEITYLHFQTTYGHAGNVPKIFSDQLQLRLYTRIFGK